MVLPVCALVATVAWAGNPVRMSDGVHGCTVQTPYYRLIVDVREIPMVRMLDGAGEEEMARIDRVWLEQDGERYLSAGEARPHFHPLRSGPYLAEVHIEQIALLAGDRAWPGLAEISLYCHEDRVYVVVALLCPEGEWMNRGHYVYPVPGGDRACPPVSPTQYGVDAPTVPLPPAPPPSGPALVRYGEPTVVVHPTIPEGRVRGSVGDGTVSLGTAAGDVPWQPGSAHEIGFAWITADNARDIQRALTDDQYPLARDAFEVTMGEFEGYDSSTGLYRITAQTSGTPEPPRGLRAGAHYAVRNDSRPRRILIDQRDPWGGISGGIMRDGDGLPLPIPVQFGLNFPEHHADAGEPGWATLTYPLELGANETREVRAEHLYHALSDRECMYLTSLDNIGDPLLLQTTVGRGESHTLTTGPYPGELKPGNELRVNDFRRIYSAIVKRSVSAILPTFFGYWDGEEQYQGLMPGFVSFRESGPFVTEYTVEAATPDGAVSGEVRVWQAPHADMTRIFTDVSLDVRRTVELSRTQPAPLFFLRHHAFNPMAFRRYAYLAEDGDVKAGELTYARTVVENGSQTAALPFACIYHADNPIDDGIPCSDITGNSGFVVLSWDVRMGRREVQPGFYAFCTGEGDPDGAYARDIALVPAEPLKELPAGSTIRYRAVQMVFGDNGSDYEPIAREREHWRYGPLRVEAKVGEVLSSDPPEVQTVKGRAEVTIEGGTDWIPVRIRGLDSGRPLQVRQTDSAGARMLGPGAPDEPWYSAWPAEEGQCGFTLLVRTDATGEPVRLEAWQ